MEILSKFVYAVMLLSALGIVVLVLLQHGKGADMGTGFGAGASGSLFGATGSANFLSRTTGVLAAVFFLSTLALAYFATNRPHTSSGGVMQNLPAQTAPAGAAIPVDPKVITTPAPEAGKSGAPKQSDIPK
ncbi:MAG: preprotein translocase subunit SecG [Burkholderiaceae bacterium]